MYQQAMNFCSSKFKMGKFSKPHFIFRKEKIIATTKIWKAEKRLDHVIDYTTNEEKTKNDYLENWVDDYDSIRQVMMYATNADKIEKQFYTTGINCDVDSAVEEMRNAKDFWHKTDGILAFHAEQSFKENEVTP